MRIRLFLLVAAGLAVASPTFAQCPPQGDGGDAALNQLKNRNTEPASSTPMTVQQFLQQFPIRQPGADENQGIVLEGYLLGAKQSGPESANCHSRTDRDFHVWIGNDQPGSVAEASAMRAHSVVVEPTPWSQRSHQNWRLQNFLRLRDQRAKVRIHGWLMYDPEHPDQICSFSRSGSSFISTSVYPACVR